MVKKIGLLLLGMVLLACLPVFAAETTPSASAIETISLEKCLELAFQNSQQLKQAAKSVEIAQAGIQEASGGFYPTVGYRYGYLTNIVAPSVNIPIPGFSDMINMIEGVGFSGTISITQPLYTGGKLTNSLKLAQINLNSALEEQRKTKQQLNYNVKEAYYRFWLAEKMLDVAQNASDNMERHYQKVNNLYKAGTASSFDLLQAKVRLENQKPQIIKAKNYLALSRLSLATLTGLEQNREFKVEYDPSSLLLPETVKVTLQSLLEEAYQKRPEIHQIQQLSEIAKTNEKLVKAGYRPTISLSCNSSWQAGNQFTLSDAQNTVSLAANLSGLIFDGYVTKSRVAKAMENQDLAQIKENNVKDQIRLEAQQALQNLEENIETIRANQANIQLAQESIKLVQIRFSAGMATTNDISDAQTALEQTLNGYYQGVSSYLIGLAKLDLIAGKDVD